MPKEKRTVRLYYECLEQALYFFKPSIQQAFGSNTDIVLVRLSKLTTDSVLAEKLALPLALKNPDGLLTEVIDGIEYPLAWIEMSTAVDTQDHELQRFDSIVAASYSQIPVLKVQAKRASGADHGGQQNFDRQSSHKVGTLMLKTPVIQVKWDTSDDELFAVREPDHKACPDEACSSRLTEVFQVLADNPKEPAATILKGRTGSDLIDNQMRAALKPVEEIPEDMRGRSTRFYFKDKRWNLKFNRWSHAMDPERGMCWYYRAFKGELLHGLIHDKEAKTTADAAKAFCENLGVATTKAELSELAKYEESAIDITKLLIGSELNRPGITIAWNCSSFDVCDEDGKVLLKLKWKSNIGLGFKLPCKKGKSTTLIPFNKVEEDDVTYAVANDVLPKNAFIVFAVSYPGAQGDFALVEGSGRNAKRTYVDIISTKKDSANRTIVNLTESKGKSSPTVLAKDAAKVLQWRNPGDKLDLLLSRMNLADKKPLVIAGIAYPKRSNETTTVFQGMSALDYVVMYDGEQWCVWARPDRPPAGFSIFEGKLAIPQRFSY
jgi:hypothetical protein